jgi:hypothetical protein
MFIDRVNDKTKLSSVRSVSLPAVSFNELEDRTFRS